MISAESVAIPDILVPALIVMPSVGSRTADPVGCTFTSPLTVWIFIGLSLLAFVVVINTSSPPRIEVRVPPATVIAP